MLTRLRILCCSIQPVSEIPEPKPDCPAVDSDSDGTTDQQEAQYSA